MILLISTCKYRLSEEEFVRPIEDILKSEGYDYEVRRYYENFEPRKKAIICGTALRDFDYLNHTAKFRTLLDCDVLGICAGYQILAKLFSHELEEIRKIGVYEVDVVEENPLMRSSFRAYFLHKLSLRKVRDPLKPLATQQDEVCAFQIGRRNVYGLSFHPEVLNEDIVVEFLGL